jgi:hypothetical protein
MTVGSYSPGLEIDGLPLIEHWNGTKWSIVPGPMPVGTHALYYLSGVACPSASSCMAVGTLEAAHNNSTLIDHWTGSRWVSMKSPNANYRGYAIDHLESVACPNVSSCIAVGYSVYGTLVEHWNGLKWSIVSSPNPSGPGELLGVACPRASRCTAVGYSAQGTLVEDWNRSKWSIVRSSKAPRLLGLDGVACASLSDCTAVGDNELGTGVIIERWNGATWSTVPSPTADLPGSTGAYLDDVACMTASSCTAVGAWGENSFAIPLVEHWNGSKWSVVPSPD